MMNVVDLPKDGKKPPLYFAFEYMEHDLSGLLTHEKVPKFSRTQIQCYMRQLLYGIAFMHGQKIMHRDIKASNLLLNNAGMLKIADFGLSRFWTEANARSGRYTNKVVTLWYRPPELLMGCTAYDYSIDMFPTTTVDLLSKMLTLDPSQRITALDALDHDYFWKIPTCKPKE
ncbi:hypothetical protein DYB34_007571 [Aphanomyces astaci]|uniref:Cyclin-dependent kinase 2 homolog n=1 Tax=Aphanomyces astaci TaxID=112090 RepID=A0A3R7D4U5_APHAT|nr:hypothetical protein DYB34_007571 [Aphanomyces astaci]